MQEKDTASSLLTDGTLAAVDLGSNSFHMIVARISDDGGIQIIDKLKEMVRLGSGLDDNKNLSEDAQQRAFDCLKRFGQRLQNIDPDNVRIVGTNTLRTAKNSANFLLQAQQLLGHSIEIISGIEEARLIYLGVSHSLAIDNRRRLVIDIGGGSTETIIGEKFTPIRMESLYMGCVNMSKRFFSDGHITKKILKKANIAAQQELESVAFEYKQTGWDQVVGSSGTIRAISSVMKVENMTDGNITWKAMKLLRKNLLNAGHIDNLQLNGLDHERRPVFAGGFVVLYALFKAFELDEMQISDGAVREGLIYDLLGRIKHEDIREITVQRLSERYSIQREHANSVAETALYLYMRVADNWDIKNKFNQKLLRWSALLHELGLTIAHAGYHKHGAYLALNSDLPGFSLQEQQFLATLIRAHRQKFPTQLFDTLSRDYVEPAIKLSILLRIAVILHRSRALNSTPKLQISTSPSKLKIKFPPDWFESHTLTYADLKNEADILKANGYTLKISD